MSAISKLIFKNETHYITSPFGKRSVIKTSAGSTSSYHQGVDYGTNGKKIPQYAIENGYVFACGKATDGALYVWVIYPRIKLAFLHYHLDSYSVRQGQRVERGTKLGVTGMSGKATGVHLHLGVRDLSPLNAIKLNSMDWESLGSCKYIDAEKIKYGDIAKTAARDEKRDQIEVLIDTLNVREKADTASFSFGYAPKGIYNFYEEMNADGYIWYRIGDNQWIASSEKWTAVYRADPQPFGGKFPSLILYSDTSVQITRWQSFLKWYGKAVEPNGKYDGATVKATKEFQKEQSGKNGNGMINPNGYCNLLTLNAAKKVRL